MSGSRVFSAWSCAVRVVTDDERVADAAAADLAVLLDRVDRAASRFRPYSALSIANARAGVPVAVPRLLIDLVAAALDTAAATGGAVDPTVGSAMRRIGYDRDIEAIRVAQALAGSAADGSPARAARSDAAPRAARPASGCGRWARVRLDMRTGLLTVPRGTALDLGATAKAWTADHAARTLAERYRTAVLVELGGDIAVAGERDGGWLVRVAERSGGDGQVITLSRGGLTTSTTTVRSWDQDGARMHHIVDPRTGLPADGPWRTGSVHADSALAANGASTAAIVLGDSAEQWLTDRGIAARLVGLHGEVVTTPGWPDPPGRAPHPVADQVCTRDVRLARRFPVTPGANPISPTTFPVTPGANPISPTTTTLTAGTSRIVSARRRPDCSPRVGGHGTGRRS